MTLSHIAGPENLRLLAASKRFVTRLVARSQPYTLQLTTFRLFICLNSFVLLVTRVALSARACAVRHEYRVCINDMLKIETRAHSADTFLSYLHNGCFSFHY